MYCPKCGKENKNANYCHYCGEPLQKHTQPLDATETMIGSVNETMSKGNTKKQHVSNRKKWIWLCVIIICAIGGIGTRTVYQLSQKKSQAKYYEKIKTAKTYFDAGEYEKAESNYTDAISIDPKKEEAYIGLVNNQLAQGENEQAVSTMEEAAKKTENVSFNESAQKLETLLESTENAQGENTYVLSVSDEGEMILNQILPGTEAEQQYVDYLTSTEGISFNFVANNSELELDTKESFKLPIAEDAMGIVGAQIVELDGDVSSPELLLFSTYASSEEKVDVEKDGKNYDSYGRVIPDESVAPVRVKMQVFGIEQGNVKEIMCEDYPTSKTWCVLGGREDDCFVYQEQDHTYIVWMSISNGQDQKSTYEVYQVSDGKLVCQKSLEENEDIVYEYTDYYKRYKKAIKSNEKIPELEKIGTGDKTIVKEMGNYCDLTLYFKHKDKLASQGPYVGMNQLLRESVGQSQELFYFHSSYGQDNIPGQLLLHCYLTDNTGLGNKLREKNPVSASGAEETTETKANYYEDDKCSFEYPEEWVGKVKIVREQAGLSVRQADYNKEYGGVLYDIQYSELAEPQTTQDGTVFVDGSTYDNPGYITCLATSESGMHAYLSSPTDVQVLPEDGEGLFDEYQILTSVDLSILESTFKFK